MPLLLALDQPVLHVVATVVLVLMLIALNVIGIQESSLMNLVLSLVDLSTQLLLVLLGVLLLINVETLIRNVHWGVAPTWGNFLVAVSLGMVTYTGIETISNMSEEAKNRPDGAPGDAPGDHRRGHRFGGAADHRGFRVPGALRPGDPSVMTALGSPVHRNDPVSAIVGQFQPAWLGQVAQVWVRSWPSRSWSSAATRG